MLGERSEQATARHGRRDGAGRRAHRVNRAATARERLDSVDSRGSARARPRRPRFRSLPREAAGGAEPVRFHIESPKLAIGNLFYMPLSPNGRKLAYTAAGADGTQRLWIRDMDTLESRAVAGTEKAVSPFWSPDSRFLAFGIGNTLKKVEASGASPPQTLCQSANAAGTGSWSADGVIVFGGRGAGPIEPVSASGGTPTP